MEDHAPMMAPVPDGSIADDAAPDFCADKPARLNAGLSLVAEYRAARLRQRPTLKTELRNDRLSLREQRAATLARKQSAHDTSRAADVKSPDGTPSMAQKDGNVSGGPSVFGQFIDHAQEQKAAAETMAVETPDTNGPAAILAEPEATPTVTAPDQIASPVPAQARGPALAAIGFGPGMVIRFRQLGIETASDLAAADEAGLRAALGDISRLVNVDVWIDSARRACAEAG